MLHMSHVNFPTMWYFNNCRLRRACAASFSAKKLNMMFGQELNTHRILKRLVNALIRLRVFYVFSQIKDIKHIRQDFHSTAWVMPQGWDLGVLWGVIFLKFKQSWCVSYLHE